MHMLLDRSELTRGIKRFAQMLSIIPQAAVVAIPSPDSSKLISWTENARSRREDELARMHIREQHH